MKRRLLAALVTVIMILSVTPYSLAVGSKELKTPEGYNENDYVKMVSFLEITDDNGVKNGEKLSVSFDPDDPDTWGKYTEWDETGEPIEFPIFLWTEIGGEMRIVKIECNGYDLFGEFDFSNCVHLESVNLGHNSGITGLSSKGCTNLKSLRCHYNRIEEIDVSENTELEELWIVDNAITSIDVSHNPMLKALYMGYNNIDAIDVSQNPELEELDLPCCFVSELDLSNNPELLFLNVYDNFFTSIDVSNNAKLESIDIGSHHLPNGDGGNKLSEIDISSNPLLTALYVEYNAISEIDVSMNPHLSTLNVSGNLLESLDVSNNPELYYLVCSDCGLASIDVTNNPELTQFDCSINLLTEIDVSGNPMLWEFNCLGNKFDYIDMTNNPRLMLDELKTEGNGKVSCYLWEVMVGYGQCVWAYPDRGSKLEGWYNAADEWLIDYENIPVYGNEGGVMTAKFVDCIMGDANLDGNVNLVDALIALRCAMDLVYLPPTLFNMADMNGDGVVTAEDVLLIMRTAMGLT